MIYMQQQHHILLYAQHNHILSEAELHATDISTHNTVVSPTSSHHLLLPPQMRSSSVALVWDVRSSDVLDVRFVVGLDAGQGDQGRLLV